MSDTPIISLLHTVVDHFINVPNDYGANDALPAAVLLQFDRSTSHYEVTFEDSNKERWKVSPDNVTTMQETLRPAFPKE